MGSTNLLEDTGLDPFWGFISRGSQQVGARRWPRTTKQLWRTRPLCFKPFLMRSSPGKVCCFSCPLLSANIQVYCDDLFSFFPCVLKAVVFNISFPVPVFILFLWLGWLFLHITPTFQSLAESHPAPEIYYCSHRRVSSLSKLFQHW